MSLPIPTEDAEQRAVVHYCRLKNYPHWHTPSETYTTSIAQKMRNKSLGVVRGIPDLFVIVNNRLIGIEMKRLRGGTVSPEQREWLARLCEAGIPSRVCKGSDEAIEFIESWQTARPRDSKLNDKETF